MGFPILSLMLGIIIPGAVFAYINVSPPEHYLTFVGFGIGLLIWYWLKRIAPNLARKIMIFANGEDGVTTKTQSLKLGFCIFAFTAAISVLTHILYFLTLTLNGWLRIVLAIAFVGASMHSGVNILMSGYKQ